MNFSVGFWLKLTILSWFFTTSSCALLDIHKESEMAKDVGLIKGKVSLDIKSQGPVIVKRYYLEKATYISDSFIHATPEGTYLFYSLPGTYYIAAFIDTNKDGEYQQNEPGNYYSLTAGIPTAVTIKPGESVEVPEMTIAGLPTALVNGKTSKTVHPKIIANIGKVTSLYNPIFNVSNYSLGMWQPLKFINQVGGGLFFLQEYQQDKIPVLFIHGINGGPLDWSKAIKGLDRKHFQPWVVYYPTGVRLDLVTEFLIKAIAKLQHQTGLNELYIMGHSMGGVVTHAFIKKYVERFPDLAHSIKLVMTVNSPLNGMASAASGVENSPIVVPVWKDIATGSAFLQDLISWQWPKSIPYHLVFSFLTGASDDGIVSLASEIPLKIQREATRIYGFNNSHVGTLNDPVFLSLFHSILAESIQ